ncbi:pentatricopeptide repeat-containing protein [Panicum miliaceum]|uniref:Pentatricopeptide repeat-containing protein n=1 Tax=Panicum miliaceum TaxID=4540 RepID=A0A3L6TE03_PANMI|nr:pentatricopeptide repeat-containing protein [Panicum miliaceum]
MRWRHRGRAAGKAGPAQKIRSAMLPRPDARAANAVMCAYLRAGRLADARGVFDRMPARDTASYSALISGHARLGSPAAAAAALLARMRLHDALAPTECTFVGLLTACARRGNPRLGAQVHALAAKSGHCSCPGPGPGPGPGSLLVDNALLGMYVKCGRLGDALRAFGGMERRDVSSWNAVLAGLVERGRHGEAFELFGEMRATWRGTRSRSSPGWTRN